MKIAQIDVGALFEHVKELVSHTTGTGEQTNAAKDAQCVAQQAAAKIIEMAKDQKKEVAKLWFTVERLDFPERGFWLSLINDVDARRLGDGSFFVRLEAELPHFRRQMVVPTQKDSPWWKIGLPQFGRTVAPTGRSSPKTYEALYYGPLLDGLCVNRKDHFPHYLCDGASKLVDKEKDAFEDAARQAVSGALPPGARVKIEFKYADHLDKTRARETEKHVLQSTRRRSQDERLRELKLMSYKELVELAEKDPTLGLR